MKKKVLLSILILVFLTILFAVVGWTTHAGKRFLEISGQQFVIHIYPEGKKYIDLNQIEQIIQKNNVTGLTDIEKAKMFEISLENNAFIDQAEVYPDGEGRFHVEVYQFKPLALVDLGYVKKVLDTAGYLKPVPVGLEKSLPYVSGNFSTEIIPAVFPVIKEMSSDTFFNKKPFRIKIVNRKEILIKLSDFAPGIFIGDTTSYRTKLAKTKDIYRFMKKRNMEKKYRMLDLRYRGQIIGKK